MSKYDGSVFCDAIAGDPAVPFVCDLELGHGGSRHRERGVANWLRNGTDLRWDDGKLVDSPSGMAGQEASDGGTD